MIGYQSIGKAARKQPLTIEFVGLPGAGKTTTSRCFSEQLRQNGLKVFVLQDLKDYLRTLPLHKKTLLAGRALLFRGYAFLSFAASLVANRIFSFNALYRFIRLTLFDLALEQLKRDRQADIILLEQWMIQELWSATIFRHQSYGKLKDELRKFYFKTDFVLYLDIDVATAAERIKGRETNLSRFDRMEPTRRVEELRRYGTYLYELYKGSECREKHLYSAGVAPEVNAASFVRRLNLPSRNS